MGKETIWISNIYSPYIAQCQGILIPESDPGKFCSWNPEIWVLESGIQLKEYGIPLTIGYPESNSTDKYWNTVPGIRNPQRGIQNPRL